jgi:polygalacturonase
MENKSKKSKIDRRNFLGGVATAAAGLTFLPGNAIKGVDVDEFSSSHTLPLEKPLPIFNVCNFGLIGDGVTLNTKAFQSLIDSCSNNGGGTIFFPPGEFLTGTFQIKNNVNIYLSPGATIWGSKNRSDYSQDCLVYAEDAKNISITGMGTINGNGKSFWEDLLKQKLSEEAMRQKMWRPENMMTFVRCNNLVLQGITVANSPAWTIHPIDCERVTITGISILNGIFEEDGPNTDGINPDGCSKLRISDCYLQCGDDCIVIKITERSATKVCRDIVVTNCVLITTETALKIGTETFGEFRNITFSNCVVHDSGGGFGLLIRDGGLIDGMVVSNITVDCTRSKNGQGIFIWSHKRTDTTPLGMIKNVIISNMTITGGGGIFIDGAKEKHIEGLTLENIRINVTGGRNTKSHDNPPHPFTVFGHRVAPYDVFCRYVDDLKLRNIQIIWPESEDAKLGSALRCWSVKDLEIAGFVGRQSLQSNAPAIHLKDVKGAFIYNCRAPEGTGTIFQLDEGTEKVTIMGNEFSRAKKLYTLGSGVDAKEIFETGNRLPS